MYIVSDEFNAACSGNERSVSVSAIISNAVVGGETAVLSGDTIISMELLENSGSSDGISIGGAFSAQLTMQIYDDEDAPQIFKDTIIIPEVGIEVMTEDEENEGVFIKATEYVHLGHFFVKEIKPGNHTKTLVCYDTMQQLEKTYKPKVQLPATPQSIMQDICEQYGFVLATENIQEYPDVYISEVDCTVRQMIGYIAGLCGCFAVFDRDRMLRFGWYSDCGVKITRDVQWKGQLSQGSSDVFTIGAVVTGNSSEPITIGSGSAVSFENPYITEAAAQSIYEKINGSEYTPLSVKWRGNPAVTVGDIVQVETSEGEYIDAWIMEQRIKISGGMHIISSCFAGNDDTDSVNLSPTAQKIDAETKLLRKQIIEQTEEITALKRKLSSLENEIGSEEFVAGAWHCRVWNSGLCECQCIVDFGDVDITALNGALFSGSTMRGVEFPMEIDELFSIQMMSYNHGFFVYGPSEEITASGIPPITVMAAEAHTAAVKISINVIGMTAQQENFYDS